IPGIRTDGEYRLEASKEGWCFQGDRSPRIRAGDDRLIRAYRSTRLDVEIVGREPPPIDAWIRLGETDEAGEFVARIGYRWNCSMAHPLVVPSEYAWGRLATATESSEVIPLALEPGGEARVTFALHPRRRVAVHVEGAVDLPLLGFSAGLAPAGAADGEYPEFSVVNELSASGETTLFVNEAGSYDVALVRGWPEILDRQRVEIGDGDLVEVHFAAPRLDPSQFAIVRSYGPRGQVLRSLSYQVTLSSPSGDDTITPQSQPRPDGGTWLDLRGDGQEESEPGPTRTLTVVSPRYGRATVPVPPGAPAEIDVHFSEPAFVDVDVRGELPSSVRNRLVVELANVTESRYSVFADASRVLGGRDRVRLGPVAPGAHQITAKLVSRFVDRPLARYPVEVVSGDNTIEISIPPLHRLVVRVPEGVTTVTASPPSGHRFVPFGGFGSEARVLGGEATFTLLPAETYTIRAEGREGEMTVDLSSDRTVDFMPSVRDCLKVSIEDAGGWLARWGFRDGDRIVSLAGRELTPETVRFAEFLFSTRGTKELEVIRNGERIPLTVQIDHIVDDLSTLGGSFEPSFR
ncbi:MAG: hypothetical protein KDC38_11625, partial [Planctomycetes bacterium]|nr:hypothetical protein [Planctomycetota bacterium]